MGYDAYSTFSGVSTVERFETLEEKVECLQTQLTSLKRDLEYMLYNIDTVNFSKNLQKIISDLKEGSNIG